MLSFRLSGLLLLLWLLPGLAIASAFTTGDHGCNLFFCLNITIANDLMTYQVTPIHEPFGWVGLGFGGMMKGTHMVVIWENEDGSKVVSQRYGGPGHIEPLIEDHPPRLATQVPATVKIDMSISKTHANYSTTAFQIPVNHTDPAPGRIIWAYSLGRPEPYDWAPLTGHYVVGTVNMRLGKTFFDTPEMIEDELSNPLPRYQKLIWHGILLSVGFLVLLPTSALVARWGRTLTPRWFKAHRILNFGVALPVIAGGFILGPFAVLDRGGSHFVDAHQICGLLLFTLYGVQLTLGRYIHSHRNVEGRRPHPPSNILHAVLGISVITLAFVQVRSGFSEWAQSTGHPNLSHWCHDALTAWSVVLPILYFGGLVLLKRQFAQEQQQGRTYDDSPEGKNYIALDAAPSPILYEGAEGDMDIAAYSEFDSAPLLRRGV
jgi:hypothetical protein